MCLCAGARGGTGGVGGKCSPLRHTKVPAGSQKAFRVWTASSPVFALSPSKKLICRELHKTATTRIAKLQKQLSSLVSKAAAAGITVDVTARYAITHTSVAYTDRMQYVKLLAEQRCLTSCTANGSRASMAANMLQL